MQLRRLILASLGVLLLSGCAGYRLGPVGGQVAGARSIQVPMARNATLEPRMVEPVTLALRRHIQQDGTFRLETDRAPADLVLETTLVTYERLPMAFRRDDVVSVTEYELRLTCRVVLRERGATQPLLDQPVSGRTAILVGADQTGAEDQAASLLADDLARRAVILISEGAW
jgi:hypothetical protein